MSAPIVYPALVDLIPHRAGMLLLDRVVAVDTDTLCAELLIRADNIFYDAASNGIGAWVGIEFMAQAIAAYEGYQAWQRGAPIKVGFLLGTRRYDSHCAWFAAGDLLQVEVQRVLEHDNGLGAFECRIFNAARHELASATVTVFKPDNVQQFLTRSESEIE